MFNYRGGRDERTENERYLESELEREREARDRENQRLAQERKERQQQMRIDAEARLRSADDWPEALQKQIYLFKRESSNFTEDNPEEDYFVQGARACERALVIWREVEASKQEQLAELEAQMEAIRASIREDVATKLEAESGRQEWAMVAQSLREDEPERFLYW